MARKLPPSKRAKARKAGSARRAAKVALREAAFEALAAGWSPQQIADARKVNVKTIRREIGGALAERLLDAPEHYVHLQVARLTKALRLADAMVDQGDLKAVGPIVKLVAALDRYHGLSDRSLPAGRAPLALAPTPEMASLPPPAPPLALTRAAPPLDEVVAVTVEGTDSGA
jgi:hypothetical protein